VSADSLSDIAGTLEALLGRQVTFTAPSGRVLGTCLADKHQTEQPEHQLTHALATAAVDHDNIVGLLCWPLNRVAVRSQSWRSPFSFRRQLSPYSASTRKADRADALDLRALEYASTVAALHFMHQRQLSQQKDRLGHALVASLLDSEFSKTASALPHRASDPPGSN
jgi:PucR family transcriptional regulator, purine catabolism regulatory protein